MHCTANQSSCIALHCLVKLCCLLSREHLDFAVICPVSLARASKLAVTFSRRSQKAVLPLTKKSLYGSLFSLLKRKLYLKTPSTRISLLLRYSRFGFVLLPPLLSFLDHYPISHQRGCSDLTKQRPANTKMAIPSAEQGMVTQ